MSEPLYTLAEAERKLAEGESSGYRVHWQHPHGGNFIGELWEDRATAEHMAGLLRKTGWCLDVRVRRHTP